MMEHIAIKGAIASDEDKAVYDYLGLAAVCPKDVAQGLTAAAKGAVTVEIDSGGGDVFAANEIFYLLRGHPGAVTADITGLAGSAATIICCAADRVRAVPAALYMIHNVQSDAYGDHRDLDHQAEVLRTANKAIALAYQQKTHLSEAELLAMMDKESWMNAAEALDKGFIDEIIDQKENIKLYAHAGTILSRTDFKNAREHMRKQNQLHLLKLKGEIRHDIY